MRCKKQLPEASAEPGPSPAGNEELTERWEQLMWRFQRPPPFAHPGEKWVPMKRLFSLRATLGEDKP